MSWKRNKKHRFNEGMKMRKYDKIIIGAGLYGLYSALFCCRRGQNVIVLECDSTPFRRATYINQARVHQGYHYPRSISTAMKSAGYFRQSIHGQMESSLKSSARQQTFRVKSYIPEIILKMACAMGYSEQGNTHMTQWYWKTISWKNWRNIRILLKLSMELTSGV